MKASIAIAIILISTDLYSFNMCSTLFNEKKSIKTEAQMADYEYQEKLWSKSRKYFSREVNPNNSSLSRTQQNAYIEAAQLIIHDSKLVPSDILSYIASEPFGNDLVSSINISKAVLIAKETLTGRSFVQTDQMIKEVSTHLLLENSPSNYIKYVNRFQSYSDVIDLILVDVNKVPLELLNYVVTEPEVKYLQPNQQLWRARQIAKNTIKGKSFMDSPSFDLQIQKTQSLLLNYNSETTSYVQHINAYQAYKDVVHWLLTTPKKVPLELVKYIALNPPITYLENAQFDDVRAKTIAKTILQRRAQ